MSFLNTISRRKFLNRGCQGAAAMSMGMHNLPALGEQNVQEYRRGGMVYRRLGATDLFVSLLGFGSHIDRRFRMRGPLGSQLTEEGQAHRDRRILRAIDLGINLFDVYAHAGQWDPMARAVKGKRDKVLLSLRTSRPRPTADVIDDGARLFGYIDLFRFVVNDTAELSHETLEKWDVLRKAKAAGKIRAIGISTHTPEVMLNCLRELEGLDWILFPYNFIHSRVAYTKFLPAAIEQNIGLLAMKPLGTGSITTLDARRPRKDAIPESSRLTLSLDSLRDRTPLLEQAVRELMGELDRNPDETLAQAALRYLFSKPFLTCALPGMWMDEELEENYEALATYSSGRPADSPALEAAARVAEETRQAWLPKHYRWLDQKWKTHPLSSA